MENYKKDLHKTKKVQLNISVDPPFKEEIVSLAEQRCMRKSAMIEGMLKEMLNFDAPMVAFCLSEISNEILGLKNQGVDTENLGELMEKLANSINGGEKD